LSSNAFELYSAYYDLLYRNKDYVREAGYVLDLVKAHQPKASKRLLDIGCGTGTHGRNFAKAGWTVHGVDPSATMLDRARKLAAESDVGAWLTYAQGDIRTIETPEPMHVVVSLFDVVSYVNSNADLRQAFTAVRRCLTPGGIFLFDYWYGPAVYSQQPHTRVRRLEDDAIRVTRVAEPVFHHGRNVVDVNYEIFVEDKSSKRIERIKEVHPMRCLFDAEIDDLAAATGFKSVHSGQWYTAEAPTAESWSVLRVLTAV
jgi:SAM-dependent methyltransferase